MNDYLSMDEREMLVGQIIQLKVMALCYGHLSPEESQDKALLEIITEWTQKILSDLRQEKDWGKAVKIMEALSV